MDNLNMDEQEFSCSSEIVEKDFDNADNEIGESDLPYNSGLQPPILGKFFRIPDLPRTYAEPITLDMSLLHVAIYAHLKTYDLEPVIRPAISPVAAALLSKSSEDTASCKSSRLVSSTDLAAEKRDNPALRSQECEKAARREQ